MHDDEFAELRTTTRNLWGTRPLEAVLERRADLAGRQEKLAAYAHRSAPQDAEHDQNSAEIIFLDELAGEKTTEARRAVIARGMAAMADPANLERPDNAIGAPALVKQTGDRLETPAESLQRMRSDPWRMDTRGPLDHETGPGLIARCHAALAGMEERLTRNGAQMLANLMSERPYATGPYEIRTAEDIRRSAAWVLALSDPRYCSAFEKIIANPEVFRSGAGVLLWDDGERQAYSDVISRAA